MASEWLTLREFAEEIRIPEATIRYWRWQGRGPKSTKLGRRVVYRRSDVDAWLAAQEKAQESARRESA